MISGVKNGVSLVGTQWQMFAAWFVVKDCYHSRGWDCIISSGTEGEHSIPNSLHYRGLALDYRNRMIPLGEREEFADEVRRRLNAMLGPGYDVVMKKDHMHTEFDFRISSAIA